MPLICPIDKTENPDTSLFCSRCKHKLTRLGPGERLVDPNLVIQSVLREDDLSITFLAEDHTKGTRYLVREYFPPNPTSRHLKKRFNDAARALQASPIAFMRILYPFTHDNRWYTVADSPEGLTLRSELDQAGPMDAGRVRQTFRSLVAVIRTLHEASLYHGNLTSDRVMLHSDGSLCLVDSMLIGEMLREGGPTSATAMMQKDVHAAGLLALELLDGSREIGDISERLASIQDLALGATLDYILSDGKLKPASAQQIEQLSYLLTTASGAPGPEASALYARIYSQYGLRRLERFSDGRVANCPLTEAVWTSARLDVADTAPLPGSPVGDQSEAATQSEDAPPSTVAAASVQGADHGEAVSLQVVDERSLDGNRSTGWWADLPLIFATVCVIGALLIAVHGWPLISRTLRVGLYNWPSVAPYYAAQIVGAKVQVEDKASDVLAKDGKGVFYYDIISMPITAVGAYQEHLLRDRWHIVWALDRSKGAEHVLVNLNRVKSGGEIDEARLNAGPIVSVRGTFAANLLKSYLGARYDDLHVDQLETAHELVANALQDSIVAIHDPFAAHLRRNGPFDDVTSSISSQAGYVNVLLVAPHVLGDERLSSVVTNFIASLPEGDEQAQSVQSDARTAKALTFFAGTDLDKEEVSRTVSEAELVDARHNFQFLYDFGDFSCANVIGHLLDAADSMNGPCRLVDERISDDVWRHLRLIGGSRFRSIPVSSADLLSLCTGPRHLEAVKPSGLVAGFDPSGSRTLTAEMENTIGNLSLDSSSYYCVIGYGDDAGGDVENVRVGSERAEAVARQMNKAHRIAFERMVQVSLGRTDSKAGKEYRRVEIKRITLRLDSTN